jgi:putative ABC transport system permease protein
MFLFLGLPAIVLAAALAAYAGGVLAAAQRREQANLRLRGAHRGHLLQILAYRTLAVAGAGSAIGVAAGFLSALATLGSGALRKASPGDLALSALIALGGGILVTALALFLPGRRALAREIGQERRELAPAAPPVWRRLWLDVVLLAAAALAEVVVLWAGALDNPPGSVFAGRSVSLPSHLLLVPLLAWAGGVLLLVRLLVALALRLPLRSPARFADPARSLLVRSLRRRPWEVAAGIAALGLVIAFGTSLRVFIATYDASKRADARFVVGSDLRITPGVRAAQPRTAAYASQLQVAGVSAVTPVVSGLENAVLAGRYKRARTDLTAIDSATFGRVTRLSDSAFAGRSPAAALAALQGDPRGVLVNAATAEDLAVEPGDRVRLVFAPGTARETTATLRVVGLLKRLAGFPRPPGVVMGLGAYRRATSVERVDFFLARTEDHGRAGLAGAVSALRSGPGRRAPLAIETTSTALGTDQSSLTALDVRSLVDLGSTFTLLMSAAVIAIFLFGLILQRRREYVVLRAQGMHARQVGSLVLGEAIVVALGGLAAGVLAGAGSAVLLVQVLRSLFILPPAVTVPVSGPAVLVLATAAAALVCALAALATLRRVRPMEILREQ